MPTPAKYIIRYPHHLNSITSNRLEHLVADIISASYTHCEVKHMGGPSDRGIDVLFINSGNTHWLIQVKRSEGPTVPEDFSTLQSIIGKLLLMGDKNAMYCKEI
ncbi:restriction endonuclease [Hymenobacter yonginensis]|uniref:restriction endonuclease n=1 Tax=Hymenobacter yonginensis TaxID=748197 RepID=UPI0038CBF9BE